MDWKKKLTSRKFWAAVCTFVADLIIAFGGSSDTATKVAAIIMAGAAVIAYIIGEGLVDAAGAQTTALLPVPVYDDPPDDESSTDQEESNG